MSNPYALAAASGALLALSFPKFGHPAVAWMALAPLLVALGAHRRSPGGLVRPPSVSQAFRLGLTCGVVYFAGTLYWVAEVMSVYGGLQRWTAVAVAALLIAYMALFPALFAVVVHRLVVGLGTPALMLAPCVWVATELGRTHLFTGFPWVLLGYSQVTVLPIAQLASLFGVYSVSALVVGVSAAAAVAVLGARRTAVPAGLVVAALVAGVAVWGGRRAAAAEWTREGEVVRVGLVQGDVSQEEKWSQERAHAIFAQHLDMTRQAIAAGANFVLWPESSTPFFFDRDPLGAAQVRGVAQQAGVPVLVGSDQVEGSSPPRYYNAAYLVRADGSTGGIYRKMHLVPFGEYVPLKKLLFFASPLVEAVSDFSAGTEAVLLPVGDHLVSTAICYEIVYPDLVRQFVRGGSELLTTITNDAWFGRTSAPYQHFAQASMRAIEEGRYLVRAANTGISGIVDPYGHVLERSRIFERVVVTGEARFLRTMTLYARIGDVFAYAAVVLTLAALVSARRRVQ